MKPPGPEAPVVLVKWYDYAKWLLERVENFPKSQRFILGQRDAPWTVWSETLQPHGMGWSMWGNGSG